MRRVEELIVGGDDSNHAGDAKGEIIAATFSFLHEDSVIQSFPNNRNVQKTLAWLRNPNRDYKFSLLFSPNFRYSASNLVTTLPMLITNYMEDEDLYPKKLRIYLDGLLKKGQRAHLRNIFSGERQIESVIVDNFIKKNKNKRGRVQKRPYCPSVVYYADNIANQLYHQPFGTLLTHRKLFSTL